MWVFFLTTGSMMSRRLPTAWPWPSNLFPYCETGMIIPTAKSYYKPENEFIYVRGPGLVAGIYQFSNYLFFFLLLKFHIVCLVLHREKNFLWLLTYRIVYFSNCLEVYMNGWVSCLSSKDLQSSESCLVVIRFLISCEQMPYPENCIFIGFLQNPQQYNATELTHWTNAWSPTMFWEFC